MEYSELRNLMVSSQLVPRGIRDPRVLEAMRTVPRHAFVSKDLQYRAYNDMALQIGAGQTISQPYMVAVMTELLELAGTEKVLEIGTGSGYQTAVLAEMAKEVYSIERIESLSGVARERLASLGYQNISLTYGDGTLGWPEHAPYQGILITAGAPDIPLTLKEQLDEGGIIVAPVGSRYSQALIKMKKRHGHFFEERHTPCVFVPLLGQYGWKEEQ